MGGGGAVGVGGTAVKAQRTGPNPDHHQQLRPPLGARPEIERTLAPIATVEEAVATL